MMKFKLAEKPASSLFAQYNLVNYNQMAFIISRFDV